LRGNVRETGSALWRVSADRRRKSAQNLATRQLGTRIVYEANEVACIRKVVAKREPHLIAGVCSHEHDVTVWHLTLKVEQRAMSRKLLNA
jgi:hypothetical protein